METELLFDQYLGARARVDHLRTRCTRLETLVIALLVVVLLSAVKPPMTSSNTAPEPRLGAGQHGSYCLWANGETLFYADHLAETSTHRQFRSFCQTRGGELLWQP